MGFTYSWSPLSATFSSVLIGYVLARGVSAVFALICSAMIVVALLGPKTNRQVLEQLSH